MRNDKREFLVLLAIVSILSYIVYYFLNKTIESDKVIKNNTVLVVKNKSTTDTVDCYLTLGREKGFVSDVNGIFGIESNDKLQGSFKLNPQDSVYYLDTNKQPIQGNISFNHQPVNCGVEVNIFEFCLNNDGLKKNAQETVDISCVSGVNVFGSIELVGHSKWTDNHKNNDVTLIRNNEKYRNTGVSGVFPYGCPYCISILSRPKCILNPSNPNKSNICQVQRDAENNGGYVIISYIGKVKKK